METNLKSCVRQSQAVQDALKSKIRSQLQQHEISKYHKVGGLGWVPRKWICNRFSALKEKKSEYSAPSRGLWDTASQLQLGLPPVVAWRQWQRWKGRWRTLHRYGQMHIDLIGTVSPLRVVSSLQRCLGSNGKHPKMLMATLATYEKRGNSFGFTQTPLWQEQ